MPLKNSLNDIKNKERALRADRKVYLLYILYFFPRKIIFLSALSALTNFKHI